MPVTQKEIISRLQQNILQWEGDKPPEAGVSQLMGLGAIEAAFPYGVFALGTVHEFICTNMEQATASEAFVSGLLSVLMQKGGACLWIGLSNHVSPLALKAFGVLPERIVFLNLLQDKEVLWAMEEALKYSGLAAVIGEVGNLDFKQSRRLQLAVEQSRVTGFVLRNQSKKMQSTACAARWQVSHLPSEPIDGLPGLGFPRWQVELLRVRNGKSGCWIMEWAAGQFKITTPVVAAVAERMAG